LHRKENKRCFPFIFVAKTCGKVSLFALPCFKDIVSIMEESKEINALLSLMDDPDEEVFGVVSKRIVDYGSLIIPTLEHWWETNPDEQVQQRIEHLIHRLHYKDLQQDLLDWKNAAHPELLTGALLCARFQYPDLTVSTVLADVEKLRRNIWLELNNYLTPLEQINVLTSILFSYYGLKGQPKDFTKPDEFLLPKVLSTKKGNHIGNGLLYLILCERLDIPIQPIRIPGQFVLAYFKPDLISENPNPTSARIEYFIEPASGQVFTQRDVDAYFQRAQLNLDKEFLQPQNDIETIAQVLGELSHCFDNEKDQFKKIELQELVTMLKS
jgi:regulator of sirC expression with transglutaminase-like and TPR domain